MLGYTFTAAPYEHSDIDTTQAHHHPHLCLIYCIYLFLYYAGSLLYALFNGFFICKNFHFSPLYSFYSSRQGLI